MKSPALTEFNISVQMTGTCDTRVEHKVRWFDHPSPRNNAIFNMDTSWLQGGADESIHAPSIRRRVSNVGGLRQSTQSRPGKRGRPYCFSYMEGTSLGVVPVDTLMPVLLRQRSTMWRPDAWLRDANFSVYVLTTWMWRYGRCRIESKSDNGAFTCTHGHHNAG